LDVLAGLDLTVKLFDFPPTVDRLSVLNIASSIAQYKDMLKSAHMDEVKYQLWKLGLLSAWQRNLRDVCDCSFLYWVTNLVPACFTDIYNNPDQVHRMQYLLFALRDPARLLLSSLDDSQHFLESYKTEVLSHLKAVYVLLFLIPLRSSIIMFP